MTTFTCVWLRDIPERANKRARNFFSYPQIRSALHVVIALEIIDSMPNAAKKIYAVRVGREGPQIYDSWAEVNFL